MSKPNIASLIISELFDGCNVKILMVVWDGRTDRRENSEGRGATLISEGRLSIA